LPGYLPEQIFHMLDNVYQPPGSNPVQTEIKTFGSYNLDRTFALAWKGFRDNIGLGIGYTMLCGLLILVSFLSCVGIIFSAPHLVASGTIVGLLMVRGQVEIGDMFRPFRQYGSVLGAFLLIYIASQLIALVFAGPSYALTLSSIDWTALQQMPTDERVDTIVKDFANAQNSAAHTLTSFLSVFGVPVSLYISGRMLLVYPLIVERGYGAIAAIKTSWNVTQVHQWNLMLLMFINGLVLASGIIACGFGLVMSIPFSFALSGAAIYQLFGEDTETATATAPTV